MKRTDEVIVDLKELLVVVRELILCTKVSVWMFEV